MDRDLGGGGEGEGGGGLMGCVGGEAQQGMEKSEKAAVWADAPAPTSPGQALTTSAAAAIKSEGGPRVDASVRARSRSACVCVRVCVVMEWVWVGRVGRSRRRSWTPVGPTRGGGEGRPSVLASRTAHSPNRTGQPPRRAGLAQPRLPRDTKTAATKKKVIGAAPCALPHLCHACPRRCCSCSGQEGRGAVDQRGGRQDGHRHGCLRGRGQSPARGRKEKKCVHFFSTRVSWRPPRAPPVTLALSDTAVSRGAPSPASPCLAPP